MKESLTIKSLDQVKALADPLRLRLLEAFCQSPMTTKQVAVLLDENPTKLYHHADVLERAGLIHMVKTRKNRGTVERYYRGVARRFAVDERLFDVGRIAPQAPEGLDILLTSALDASLTELRRSISERLIVAGKKSPQALVARARVLTTESLAADFFKKVEEWLEQLHDIHDGKGTVEYGLTVAFYPVKRKPARRSRPKD